MDAMTDRLNILDEIDGPINQIRPKFKKKVAKTKATGSQRVSFPIDDQDEDGDGDGDSDDIGKPKTHGSTKLATFKTRKPFKSFQSSIIRNRNTTFGKMEEDAEHQDNMAVENFYLELDDDPENDPVIENISELGDFKLRTNEVANASSMTPVAEVKKYVPIETNKFSIKISQKDLKDEYKDEQSLDFNEDDVLGKDTLEDSDVEMKQDHFIDDVPLKIRKAKVSEKFQQISDKYDIEIGSGSESELDKEDVIHTKSNSITVKKILTLQEQVTSLKDSIANLTLKKSEYEQKLVQINTDLEDIKQEKQQLQANLDSFEW